MDADLFRFLGTAGLFLGVMVVLRRLARGRAQAQRDHAAPTPIAPGPAAGRESRDQRGFEAGRVRSPPPIPVVTAAAARPAAPVAHHESLDRIAEQAVLLRRHVPPRPDAPSFWGGVPLVPPGFEWPHFTPEGGSPRALSFLLQVDCAAIPAEARLGVMPDRGLLYFFLDLDWGAHWKWRVLHADADPSILAPAAVPAALPRAYGQRDYWSWPRRDEDWPRLLPRFSVDPVVIRGSALPAFGEEDDDERFVWPGSIDVAKALEGIEGAIVESRTIQNRYEDGILQRPYASFPQDWQAVRIALGHLARQSRRHGPLDRMAARPETAAQAEVVRATIEDGLAKWGARADAADPALPLDARDRDAFWDFFVSVQPVSLFALTEAARQSLDATIAANPMPGSVLDEDAMDFARTWHAFALRGERGLHVRLSDRMLSAPTEVQDGAAERAREWLMLLELSSDASIGHHLGEGVLQFCIRPEDLAARRFDRVDLYATAY